MTFPSSKESILKTVYLIKGQPFIYKRVLVKIRTKEERVKSWASKEQGGIEKPQW